MSESLCLISAKFSSCILMINSYFPHAMKMCTIKAPLRNVIFLSDLLLLKILMREMFLDKMVKLTNMLVEPRI
jgi:hypothetical protein